MTHSGIECFLAICRHKNGSAAAQALYITQPSLSNRLKVLERELGTQLFYRCKGSREMALTPAGHEFFQLALEYEALIEQMHKLGQRQKTTLRVSCFNSLGTYLLPDVYKLFLQSHPQFSLQTQDMEIHAARQSILRGETDLAFTSGNMVDQQLKRFPAFSEPMVLVCAANSCFGASANLSELPPNDEVYVQWSNSFDRWHQKTLGIFRSQLCVSIMTQLRQFLEQENHWAIVPVSVAKGLEAECRIRQLKTDIPLPFREVSYVTGAQSEAPALEEFLDCLKQVLATNPEIKVFL